MPTLTVDDVADRFWTFGLPNGTLMARNVVLARSGEILHCNNSPNEDRWRVEDGGLELLARDGRVSCRMAPVPGDDPGRLWLEGEHVLGGPSGLMLALRDTGVIYPVHLPWSGSYDAFAESVPFYCSANRRIRGVNEPGKVVSMFGPVFVEPEACLPARAFLTVGAYSYCHGPFRSESRAVIGRYCSIAGDASPFGPAHPIDRVTSSTVTYDPRSRDTARRYGRDDFEPIPFDQAPEPVIIENDVWIGEGVRLRGGIRVGTGAVVATNSVVTRDVPPYAIVAGVPAKVIRMRFPDPLAARLLKSRWWDYNFPDLPACFDQPDRFLDELEALKDRDAIRPWLPTPIDLAEALLRIVPKERPRP